MVVRLSNLKLCVLAFLAGGCGTTLNTLYFTPGEGGQQIYGGVKLDSEIIRAAVRNQEVTQDKPWQVGFKVGLATLDLPLSSVGDTLTLPMTVGLTFLRDGPPREYVISN